MKLLKNLVENLVGWLLVVSGLVWFLGWPGRHWCLFKHDWKLIDEDNLAPYFGAAPIEAYCTKCGEWYNSFDEGHPRDT